MNNSELITRFNSQNRKNIDYIRYLEKRIEDLERQLDEKVIAVNKDNVYDVFIYIFSGVFILFVLDLVLRLGKFLRERKIQAPTFQAPPLPTTFPRINRPALNLGETLY